MNRNISQAALDTRPASPRKLPDRINPDEHEGERATVWVRVFLFLGCTAGGLLLAAGLWAYWLWRSPGEPLPNFSLLPEHKVDQPATAFDVVTRRGVSNVDVLVADDEVLHYGRSVKDLFLWQHFPLASLRERLPASGVVVLSAGDARSLVVCRERDGARNGVTAALLPPASESLSFWTQSILDTSSFPGVDDQHAHCLLDEPLTRTRLVGAVGLGVYDPPTRRWLACFTTENSKLSLEEVYDLANGIPSGEIALMGVGGIDFGAVARVGNSDRIDWNQKAHYDRGNGLVGNDVRHGRVLGSTLVYITGPGGLGRLELGDDPPVAAAETLVGEGRAPGLTRDSLRRADEDRSRQAVWMVYDAPESPDSLAAALYETDGHQMAATAADTAWPASDTLALAADPYDATPGAWVGGKQLRNVTLTVDGTGQRQLQLRTCGLNDREIDEIALNQQAVFVHAQRKDDSGSPAHPTIEAATRQQIQARNGSAFRIPYIGSRRFAHLTDSDLTAACDAQAEGQSAIYFGTKDKGIGVFLRGSRELFQAYHSEHPDPRFRVPCDGTLDLAAFREYLVQVGSNRTLALFNGSNWKTLIAEGGIDIDPRDVKTVVADGQRIVIGAAGKIGYYDTQTHEWAKIPPIENLERLAIGIGRLWAIDGEKTLHSLSLSDVANQSWTEADRNVIDFFGDAELVAVVAGTRSRRHLWLRPKDGVKRLLVSPRALAGGGTPWNVAAVSGGKLYLAPHNKGIGCYDLNSHAWDAIPFPADDVMLPRELVATAAGLWFLGSDEVLYYLAEGHRIWEKAVENVKWLDTDGVEVVVLGNDGSVQRSSNGTPPMATLVGDAFSGQLDEVKGGIVFQGQLFVGTDKRVGRYEVNRHSWHNYEGVEGVVQFAFTANFLYGLTGQKEIKRYSPAEDTWTDIVIGDGSIRAAQLAGAGGSALCILLENGAVMALPDQQADAVMLIAATQLGKGAIGAAAEADRALFLGLDNGTVARYGKTPGQPWVWSPVFQSDSPLRQLLVPAQADRQLIAGRQLVAVGDKVWLLSPANDNNRWNDQTLLDERDVYGVADSTDFYGLRGPGGDQDAQMWRVALATDARPLAYLGDRFPESKSSQTVAVGVSGSQELFRADEEGNVAQYDITGNGWTKQGISTVRQFLRVGQQLWAWVPDKRTLSRWDETWKTAESDQNVEHVVGDGQAMLIAKVDGTLLMRTERGDTTLLQPPANPLPIQDASEIKAAAEHGDLLFLALANKPLLAYDRKRHLWREEDLRGVVQLERLAVAGAQPVLFGRTESGGVHYYDAARDAWASVNIPGEDTAAKLVPANAFMAIRTAGGDIHLADATGQIRGSYQPQMIANRKADNIKLTDAAELNGRLIILPDLDTNHELWCYDADQHAWTVDPIRLDGGRPSHFLKDDGLWLVVKSDQNGLSLYPVASTAPILGDPITNLLDATSDGESIWVVTADHRLRKVDDQGELVATGIPEVSLPAGRTVQRAFAVADHCGMLLDDGSVYHYVKSKRQWEEQIAPLPEDAEFQGALVRDANRWLILSRPKGEVWVCDVFNGKWREVPRNEGISDLPPISEPPADWTPAWTIEGTASHYKYFVNVDGKRQKRQLNEGRFDWDLPQKVVPDEKNGVVWVQTPAGPRKYVRNNDGEEVVWKEVFEMEDEYREPTIARLEFDGQRFACRRDKGGLWPTAEGTPATLEMKMGERSVVLEPGNNSKGAGFAHDVINDVAALGRDLWLATDGGAVRVDQLPGMKLAEISGADQGLKNDPLEAILAEQKDVLVIRSSSGDYAERSGDEQQTEWTPRTNELGAESFARAKSVGRYNALLDNWWLNDSGLGVTLQIRLGDEPVPVGIGPNGFGFDRPQAFSLADNRVYLWTVDGLAELDRKVLPGPLAALDPTRQLPTFEGYADILDERQDQRPWLRSLADDAEAWQFTGREWEPATIEDYEQAMAVRRPLLLDQHQIKWDRQDQVTFSMPGLNQAREFTTQFDAARGRFLLSIPYDIAVFKRALWVLTAGGIVQMDRQKRWSDVMTMLVPDRKKTRLVFLRRENRLVAKIDGKYHEWTGQSWKMPVDTQVLAESIRRQDSFLVDGGTWQLKRDEVQGERRDMTARLNPTQEFQQVVLDANGLFNFERVHSLIDDGVACLCATDFGLIRSDPAKVDFTHLWRQDSPAERLGRWKQKVYARLASREEVAYDNVKFEWKSSSITDVFRRIESQVVNRHPWSWILEDGQLRVLLAPQKNGIWEGTQPLSVGLAGGRFDFDTVYDVGQHKQPWLVTAAGLLARQGKGLFGISEPRPFQSRAAIGERSLFSVTTFETPVLFAKSIGGLLRCTGNAWASVPSQETSTILDLWKTQEARSAVFDVTRSQDGRLSVGLHLPEDSNGLYKLVKFDPSLGLFTFDDLRLITRLAGQDASVLAGTAGGVALFSGGPADGSSPFRRLFCDTHVDGIGSVHIDGILLGKRRPVNLLAVPDSSGGRFRYYQLKDGQWSEQSLRQQYELERRTVVFDPDGWQVLALKDLQDPSLHTSQFDMQWRGEPVQLLNLSQTGDAESDITRFAHDVPLSVGMQENGVWVATRGGVVAFPAPQGPIGAGTIDLTKFDLYAKDVLTPEELEGSRPPTGVVLVRSDKTDDETVYARRADGTVLKYDPSSQSGRWTLGDAQADAFQAACRVAEDSFWAWSKDGSGALDELTLLVDTTRAKLPENYQWLAKGTWAFLETEHPPQRAPRRTIVFCRRHLYMATPGGVARFPEPDSADSVWPGSPRDFIDAVYAVADEEGSETPMLDIEELFWDEKAEADGGDDRLYARSADGTQFVFEEGSEAWSVCKNEGDDPFRQADVVVDNQLLTWALTETGWVLRVNPLLNDMPDQSHYPLFINGRFAFDDVRHFSAVEDQLWLATCGGVCAYKSRDFSPEQFFAGSMLEVPEKPPNVQEIVAADSSRVYCRLQREDGTELTFEYSEGQWTQLNELPELDAAEETFHVQYKRAEDHLMKFFRYPSGLLEAELKDQQQKTVLGKARGANPFPLFANNRFSFDDIRQVALEGDTFWAATPAGVVEYRMNWEQEVASPARISCRASKNGTGIAMAELEGIARFPRGDLLAWNGSHVFRTSIHDAKPHLGWSVFLTGADAEFRRQMVLPDGRVNWVLRQDAGDTHAMQLLCLPQDRFVPGQEDRSHDINSDYHSPDVSTARMDDKWIYQRVDEGGVIRIPKAAVD